MSDYGLADEFVGICHGVIATICPEARVIDLSHGIPRHDVLAGAAILAGALPYLPAGVHIAVVDPGVGGRRRAVALRVADGRVLVGPDNGLLWPAAQRGGGIVEAIEISLSPLRLEPVSATFHGRDIFAPVGAHIAAGRPVAETGTPLDPGELVTLELPEAQVEAGRILAQVIYADRFGNVQLAATHADAEQAGLRLGREVEVRLASREVHTARFVRTFADVKSGQLIVYEDATRRLAIAFSHGNAAGRLRLSAGDEVIVAVAP